MIKISAKTLEEAYLKACKQLNTSIVNIHFEVIQNHSPGFMGFLKKDAIILAEKKGVDKDITTKTKKLDIDNKIEINTKEKIKTDNKPKDVSAITKDSVIFDNFYKDVKNEDSSINYDAILDEIRQKLKLIFSYSCYEIDTIEVSMYDDETIFIKIDGKDNSLLIGKSAKRYKALSYMLFNWIKLKYGLLTKLEISKFLETQENNIKLYIDSIQDKIDELGYGKTKTLDGFIIHTASKELKKRFQDKYVGIRKNERGKYIIVNELRK